MEAYVLIKHLHMTAAYLTAGLFLLRVSLDALGKTGWRLTPLRWLPHINDSLLLVAALLLLALSGWMPGVHAWLTFKLVLLVGYILAGWVALRQGLAKPWRLLGALLALAQLAGIFFLAIHKPVF
ncbi:SirB2 family protein [Marinospirillum perlucidum]|uniref:SirB2 family protein n=1 Tax=Marinospirillum perlucidum TaxID=1982602 RepID=UPI000DF1FDEA|nr:SirB2 family protein [Marinospirillum perlucidum]